MGKVINYNLTREYFEKDRNNHLEARLARIELEKGDILRFNEIDESGKPTGRHYDRVIKDLHKIHKATKYWSKEDLTKFGLYIFELE